MKFERPFKKKKKLITKLQQIEPNAFKNLIVFEIAINFKRQISSQFLMREKKNPGGRQNGKLIYDLYKATN